jgi:hypothetical protein
MAKSISVMTKKGRGRPVTTGKGTLIGVRLLDAPLADLDHWIEKHDDPHLTRPEAIRRLVDLGLKTALPTVEQISEAKSHAAQAAKLAAELGLKAKSK